MQISQIGFPRQRSAVIVPAAIPRIVPDGDLGGWFVVDGKNKFGWLYGSRVEAVEARDLLHEEMI
jgi:hypothetical protein